jgi:hypothetical protein
MAPFFISGEEKMAVPESKTALLEAMEKSASALRKKLIRIPADIAYQQCLEGHVAGSRMSVANLVSYLIGWGEQVLYWHQQEAAGEEIDFPAKGFKWNELGSLRKNTTLITSILRHGQRCLPCWKRINSNWYHW